MGAFGPEAFKTKDGREVIVRHCQPEDVIHFGEFQQQIASETNFTMQAVGKTPSPDKVQENWKQCQEDPLYLRLGAFDGPKIIAQLGFRPLTPAHPWTAHVGQFGMMVLKDYWGQGIGRRMLEIMDEHARTNQFTRIEAMVRVKNDRGVKLYKNAGYSIEGTRRCAAKIDGECWDEYFIAKLLDKKINSDRKTPRLQTDRVILRLAVEEDVPEILRYFDENRDHLAPTDPPKPEGFHTESFWQERVRKSQDEFAAEQAIRFFIFDKKDDRRMIGTANFTQMFRGPFQACYVGYGISKEHEGKGIMFEALRATIDYIFRELNFHRIMANHLTENERSARLLKRLGFVIEGQAKNYLLINGAWRDHVLTSLTNPNWKGQ